MNDHELLHDYAKGNSQASFNRLVERHLPLVWTTARRLAGNAHTAEDVVQQVFSLLARKAGKLGKQVILSGWLYRTTCHIAARTRRGEQRRAIREQEAVIGMKDAHQDPVWLQIEPLLDSAMSSLDERDRDAICAPLL